MKRVLCSVLFYLMVSLSASAQAPCDLVSSLDINTGYNHITGRLLTGGQRDTFWKVTAISGVSASMYPGSMPALPYASHVAAAAPYWPTRTSTCDWISFLPAATYIQPAVVEDDSLWADFTREFRLCSADTVRFSLQLVNDNYCPSVTVDAVPVPLGTPFSQAKTAAMTVFTMWHSIPTFTVALAAGVHRLTFRIHNYDIGYTGDNPTGMAVQGSIASVSGKKSLVGYASAFGCSCGCSITLTAGPKDTLVCPGAVVKLRSAGAASYSWSPASGLDNPSIPDPKVTVTGPAVYVVTGTNASGCTGTDTVRIKTVSATPLVVSPDTLVCIGARVHLKVSGTGDFSWSPGKDLDDSTTATPIFTARESTRFRVAGTGAEGCSDTAYVNIVALPVADITVTPSDTMGCIGQQVQLQASGALRYKWFPPSGLNNDTIANPIVTLNVNKKYLVRGWDADGCLDEDTVTINAYPPIRVKVTADKNYINGCGPDAAELTATGATNYSWVPAVYCDDPDKARTQVRPPHTLVFTVTGTDGNGCISQDTITIFKMPGTLVGMPNSFTPNGDGLNDDIRPLITCDFILDEFGIYNRWGEQMFLTRNNESWDGSYQGVPANSGVYYYYVKGHNSQGEPQFLKGDITLIK